MHLSPWIRKAVAAAPARAAPTKAAERIGALDFVRGWALFGILLMNITGFGLSHAYDNPVNNGGSTGADLWAWIIIQVGFEGTQRGLFSVLFGAGIVLLTRRLEATIPADASDIYARRNLWLIGFGLFNAWILIWEGDILFVYGVTALFAYGFRRLSPRWLIGIGLASMLLIGAFNLKDANEALDANNKAVAAQKAEKSGAKLSEEQKQAISKWKEMQEEFTPPRRSSRRTSRRTAPAGTARSRRSHRSSSGWKAAISTAISATPSG